MNGLTDRKLNIVSEDFPLTGIPMKHLVVHYFADPDFWMHGYFQGTWMHGYFQGTGKQDSDIFLNTHLFGAIRDLLQISPLILIELK